MITCINDAMFPNTGAAVVRLLRRLGVEVDFPDAQTCCGQPIWPRYLPRPRPPRAERPRSRPARPMSGRRAADERDVHRHAVVPRSRPDGTGRRPVAPQPRARHAHHPR
ncbi:heterodisulfide reductase-related iron-sulfur binding cluster [Saccharopolyspora pogona]|uniref:heterodisulfide reductase-related iron-sulfur binding cluster n=1 Tax=Saccharopolyspora pogona TaxID=333966 RepID=UPI0037C7CDB9